MVLDATEIRAAVVASGGMTPAGKELTDGSAGSSAATLPSSANAEETAEGGAAADQEVETKKVAASTSPPSASPSAETRAGKWSGRAADYPCGSALACAAGARSLRVGAARWPGAALSGGSRPSTLGTTRRFTAAHSGWRANSGWRRGRGGRGGRGGGGGGCCDRGAEAQTARRAEAATCRAEAAAREETSVSACARPACPAQGASATAEGARCGASCAQKSAGRRACGACGAAETGQKVSKIGELGL